jgi:hypothetical protein
MSVMGNAYPQSGNRNFQPTSIDNDEDADWDAGMDTDTVSLLEENARLRALVVRLSDLVLRSVVDEK